MIRKQTNSFTGDVEYTQCDKCLNITNFDRDECECEKGNCGQGNFPWRKITSRSSRII